MQPETDRSYIKIKKTVLVIAILVITAGLIGWMLGRSGDDKDSGQPSTTQNNPANGESSNTASADAVKDVATYTLPDGWKEFTCPSSTGSIYVVPNGADGVDCDANPSAPVKISIDPANNTDCNQLQNVQNVSKHICSSEYINGQKSLRAETIYNEQSSYKKDTTVRAYYIDTGKGVIKVEYVFTSDDNFQMGFEQLAKSVKGA